MTNEDFIWKIQINDSYVGYEVGYKPENAVKYSIESIAEIIAKALKTDVLYYKIIKKQMTKEELITQAEAIVKDAISQIEALKAQLNVEPVKETLTKAEIIDSLIKWIKETKEIQLNCPYGLCVETNISQIKKATSLIEKLEYPKFPSET